MRAIYKQRTYWLNVLLIVCLLANLLPPTSIALASTIADDLANGLQHLSDDAAPIAEGTAIEAASVPAPREIESSTFPPPEPSGLMFIENVGQFDPKARFIAYGLNGSLYLARDDNVKLDGWVDLLEAAGHPVITIQLDELEDLGGDYNALKENRHRLIRFHVEAGQDIPAAIRRLIPA